MSSTSDYYPFGLEMEGRSYNDTTSAYRYGLMEWKRIIGGSSWSGGNQDKYRRAAADAMIAYIKENRVPGS